MRIFLETIKKSVKYLEVWQKNTTFVNRKN